MKMSRDKTKTRKSAVHGEIRHRRNDTLVRTLREEYGEHFGHGFRGETKLQDLLHKEKVQSLSEYLQRHRPIYVRNRFATAKETARTLGVPSSRANKLIKLAKQSLPVSTIARAKNGTQAEFRVHKSMTAKSPVVFAAKKKSGSPHGEFKIKKTKTTR